MKARGYVFFVFLVMFVMTSVCLTACGQQKEEKRGKDWDYTVVPTADCPKDFLTEIEKKKINPFFKPPLQNPEDSSGGLLTASRLAASASARSAFALPSFSGESPLRNSAP